jgi:hypothetical protein
MSRTKNSFLRFCLIVFSLFFIYGFIHAQIETQAQEKQSTFFDNNKILRIGADLSLGIGFEKFDMFETTTNEIVTLSPGGGIGGKLSAGYCITPVINLNAEIGFKESTLSEDLENADGGFSRSVLLGTLRYKIPINPQSSINIGGGVGYYMGGKLNVDASEIGGGHNKYKYDNATGFHAIIEYEQFLPSVKLFSALVSWGIGIKYYSVSYKLSSLTSDGVSIPLSLLPQEVMDELSEINGSGIDFVFLFIMHI